MTWIRDNIVKIAIVLGILIVIIIIVALIPGGGKEVNVVTANGYEELENKLQSAAINFVDDNPKFLPSTIDTNTTIKYSTLQKNNYIGTMYAVDDSNIKCDGEVVISKITNSSNSYRFLPYIKCGNKYTTQKIYDYIVSNEKIVTKDDGLYKEGDTYRYKGEYPNNYILIDGKEYRIISLLSDGSMKLIKTDRTKSHYIWDDRYNSTIGKYYGITNFEKSRMNDNLSFLYNNTDSEAGEVFFTSTEKDYFLYHEFCNGNFPTDYIEISLSTECKTTINNRIGFVNPSDYYLASIDSGCNVMGKDECTNYNYMNYYTPLILMNLTERNTYEYLNVDGGYIYRKRASSGMPLYISVFISGENAYRSGSGTKNDPYVLR